MATLQTDIEQRLADAEPQVEVLLAEVVGANTLRVFIDRPDGVTLDLCERVTRALSELRERYTLEVSSPGIERPLSKPEHFRRFVGRRARVRTRTPWTVPQSREDARADAHPRVEAGARTHAARRSFTGELVGATEHEITLAADGGVVAIPYADISRSNLVEE
jgi:ribosome maturation factor RimP